MKLIKNLKSKILIDKICSKENIKPNSLVFINKKNIIRKKL